MKKLITIALLAAIVALPAMAAREFEEPEVGAMSIGITFNPVSLGQQVTLQPKNGEQAGAFIEGLKAGAKTNWSKQMFVLSQDPVATLRFKYRMAEKWNIRASVGVLGSHISYKEYVQDDLALKLNPDSRAVVVDDIHSNLNGASIIAGGEFVSGKGRLKFVAGFNIMYSVAAGNVVCKYGNAITADNQAPTTIGMMSPTPAPGGAYAKWAGGNGIAWGRLLKSNFNGGVHGLGVSADMGIEWFFIDKLSLGAAVTFTPVMFTFQGQSYDIYEGYSTKTHTVIESNQLYTPGSWGVLYGTENLGLNLSLNYYF